MPRFVLLFLSCAVLFFNGCATSQKPTLTAVEIAKLTYENAPRNEKVRVAVEVGCQLISQGYADEAQSYLLKATDIIEAVYTEDKCSEKAASLWHGESEKIFRGEPYERSLTYLYLGLTFLAQSDFENARNCFRSSSLQDAFAADDQHDSDFYAAQYLEAYCEYSLGNQASCHELLVKVQQHQPALGMIKDDHDFMLMCQTGYAPLKTAEGDYGERLTFGETTDDVWAIEMTVGGERFYVYDTANTFYQAVTRGGRFVDHVLKRKAKYKKTAKVSADVLWTAGTICLIAASQTSDDAQMYLLMAGVGCYAVGGVVHIAGECMNPNADTRSIASFPNRLYFRSCEIPKGSGQVEIRYYGRYLEEVRDPVFISLPVQAAEKLLCSVSEKGVITNWEVGHDE